MSSFSFSIFLVCCALPEEILGVYGNSDPLPWVSEIYGFQDFLNPTDA